MECSVTMCLFGSWSSNWQLGIYVNRRYGVVLLADDSDNPMKLGCTLLCQCLLIFYARVMLRSRVFSAICSVSPSYVSISAKVDRWEVPLKPVEDCLVGEQGSSRMLKRSIATFRIAAAEAGKSAIA